ncbi:dihydrofolate reductase [Actinomadura craniellae]|uniref:Dihydrofolate reductase n=1 Tax=Actinomadura craniellae TaxID=2231787 RepID=A0A365H8T8_9ACTN|nr:dihydrofolate reductase family protein [Actinomadura craniellae]RAY15491.1 dihydrofolate reductase [Actinomadura craniellae]
MRRLTYYVATTIDGFIAAPDGSFGFFPADDRADEMAEFLTSRYPETVPTHVREHMGLDLPGNRCFDTVVMGHGTYRPALDIGVTSPYRHLRQYVVSTALTESPDPEVELVPGDPAGLVRRLKREEGLGIWLAGGGRLAGALLPEIDELIVKRYPLVIGTGIPVFTAQFQPRAFELTDTRVFGGGAVVLSYTRA